MRDSHSDVDDREGMLDLFPASEADRLSGKDQLEFLVVFLRYEPKR
jgi:hypothetical protein